MKAYPLEKFRASENQEYRIAFLSRNAAEVHTHYIEKAEGSMYFWCFEGTCCEVLGPTRPKVAFWIAMYDTSPDGQIISANVTVRYMVLGKKDYDDLVSIDRKTQNTGGLENLDFCIRCSDEKYQKYTIFPIGEATWKKYPEMVNFIMPEWEKLKPYLQGAIARTITLAQFLEAVGGGAAITHNPSAPQNMPQRTYPQGFGR